MRYGTDSICNTHYPLDIDLDLREPNQPTLTPGLLPDDASTITAPAAVLHCTEIVEQGD